MRNKINSLILITAFFMFLGEFGFCLPPEAAEAISVTSVKVENKAWDGVEETTAEITINDFLKIREIRVRKSGDRVYLKLPEYVSKWKRIYPQARILTKQANYTVRKAIEDGRVSGQANNTHDYQVTKFTPYRKISKLKVFAAVSFCGSVEVECKVIEGKYGPMIAWPSRKQDNTKRWINQIFITNKRIRETVEQDLLGKYYQMVAEGEIFGKNDVKDQDTLEIP